MLALHTAPAPWQIRVVDCAPDTSGTLAANIYPTSHRRAGATVTAHDRLIRQITAGLKAGDDEAITDAAAQMARLVPPNSTLVPLPSSDGRTERNLQIAHEIALLVSDARIKDVLVGEPHESSTSLRQIGKPGLSADQISMSATQTLTESSLVLIDNVVTTGATAQAAKNALGRADALALCWAKSQNVVHRATVEQAIRDGHRVPADVLADYPDLAGQSPQNGVSAAQLLAFHQGRMNNSHQAHKDLAMAGVSQPETAGAVSRCRAGSQPVWAMAHRRLTFDEFSSRPQTVPQLEP